MEQPHQRLARRLREPDGAVRSAFDRQLHVVAIGMVRVVDPDRDPVPALAVPEAGDLVAEPDRHWVAARRADEPDHREPPGVDLATDRWPRVREAGAEPGSG
jgi:hypothetical protein